MKWAIILAAILLAPTFCRAENTIGVHLGSYHTSPGFNNANPGLYGNFNGWTVGTYYNSERRQSVYAGYTWEHALGPARVGVTVGAISGYTKTVMPMVVPSVSLNDPLLGGRVRISYAAKVHRDGAHAFHLSHEWSF